MVFPPAGSAARSQRWRSPTAARGLLWSALPAPPWAAPPPHLLPRQSSCISTRPVCSYRMVLSTSRPDKHVSALAMQQRLQPTRLAALRSRRNSTCCRNSALAGALLALGGGGTVVKFIRVRVAFGISLCLRLLRPQHRPVPVPIGVSDRHRVGLPGAGRDRSTRAPAAGETHAGCGACQLC